jgi:hypothetical protein
MFMRRGLRYLLRHFRCRRLLLRLASRDGTVLARESEHCGTK